MTSANGKPSAPRSLRWARRHADADTALAVNNHYIDPTVNDSRSFYCSAFAERRVFLESWNFTVEGNRLAPEALHAGVKPFPVSGG